MNVAEAQSHSIPLQVDICRLSISKIIDVGLCKLLSSKQMSKYWWTEILHVVAVP